MNERPSLRERIVATTSVPRSDDVHDDTDSLRRLADEMRSAMPSHQWYVKDTTEVRDHKVRRMLMWFEQQLPDHEPDDFQIYLRPNRIPVEQSTTTLVAPPFGLGHLDASCWCANCHRSFTLDHNRPAVYDQDGIPAAVEKAKKLLRQVALSSGKCWASVPLPDDERGWAVLDTIASR